MYSGLFLACGVFFIVIAFSIFLPVMVLAPQKFATCFTMGCGFIVGSFFALTGPKNQLAHMITKERLPFTLGFLLSDLYFHGASQLHSFSFLLCASGHCTVILCDFLLPWRISRIKVSPQPLLHRY